MLDQEKSDYPSDVTSTTKLYTTSTSKNQFVHPTVCFDRRKKQRDKLNLPGFLIQD